ncbi:MAG: peptidase T [Catonella sp.]|nr:peptidase T [Catonella sp.]
MAKDVKERFLDYVSYDTQSEEGTDQVPSTAKQLKLAEHLVEELKGMGIEDVKLLDHGYVFATVPATSDKDLPVLGFISHMDTSDAISGADIKPREIKNYDGNDIVLNEALNIVLKTSEFPEIKDFTGEDLIVTDGTTLLGADDKAGLSEIISMAEYFMEHPEIKHGKIRLGFTPDEEVGHGTKYFDVDEFGADYAYTVDGGRLGSLEYENFNAAEAMITISGSSTHPGSAKWKMKDAVRIAREFADLMPVYEDPYCTEGREGFIFLIKIEGTAESAKLQYIIRDHDSAKFEEKKAFIQAAAAFINVKYGAGTVKCDLHDQYYNMKEMIEPNMHLIENAKRAMEDLGIKPLIEPVRGGTDGAMLSFNGLPCPNLNTGGMNYHGKYEYVSVTAMRKIVELLEKIVLIYSE